MPNSHRRCARTARGRSSPHPAHRGGTARAVRRLTAACAVVSLVIPLTACGQEARGGSRYTPEEGDGGTVGLAMPTQSAERWVADGANMAKEFEAAGYETDLQYGDDRVEEQVAQVENMIAQGHRLIVVAAIDGGALTDVLNRAEESGIPVIAYDRLITGTENVDYYASFDNERVGRLQGQYIVDALELDENASETFTVELFAGSPDDNNSQYFWNGAMAVLEPYIASGQLVIGSGQQEMNQATTLRWEGGTAQRRMDDLLSQHYAAQRLDAVLAPADSISIGVLSALRSAGYGTANQPFPVVTGQDAELASVKSIIAGNQTQTIFKDTRALAARTAEMGDALLNGEEPEVNNTEDYHNGEKIVPAYLLEPVSVDADNVDLLVDEGYYTEEQLR